MSRYYKIQDISDAKDYATYSIKLKNYETNTFDEISVKIPSYAYFVLCEHESKEIFHMAVVFQNKFYINKKEVYDYCLIHCLPNANNDSCHIRVHFENFKTSMLNICRKVIESNKVIFSRKTICLAGMDQFKPLLNSSFKGTYNLNIRDISKFSPRDIKKKFINCQIFCIRLKKLFNIPLNKSFLKKHAIWFKDVFKNFEQGSNSLYKNNSNLEHFGSFVIYNYFPNTLLENQNDSILSQNTADNSENEHGDNNEPILTHFNPNNTTDKNDTNDKSDNNEKNEESDSFIEF